MSQRVNAGAPTAAARAAPDAVIEALWLVAVVLVPLTFGPPESFAFADVPKVALTRLLAVLIAAVWAVDIAIGVSTVGTGAMADWRGRLSGWLRAYPPRWTLVAAAFLLVVAALSAAVSPIRSVGLWGFEPGRDGQSLLNSASVLVVFFAVALRLRTRAQLWRLAGALAGGTLLASLYVVAQAASVDPFNAGALSGGVAGSFGFPQAAGAALLLGLPVMAVLVLAWAAREQTQRRLTAGAVVVAIVVAALALTQARGPWAGALVALALLASAVWLVAPRRLAKQSLVALAASAALAAALVVPVYPSEQNDDSPPDGSSAQSWESSLDLAMSRPWFAFEDGGPAAARHLLGYGPDAFVYVYPLGEQPALPEDPDQAQIVVLTQDGPNQYVHAAVEQGVLGLLAALAVTVVPLAAGGWALVRRSAGYPWEIRLLLAALLASIAGWTVVQLSGVTQLSDSLIGWAVLGLLVALPRTLEPEPTPRADAPRWRPLAAVASAAAVITLWGALATLLLVQVVDPFAASRNAAVAWSADLRGDRLSALEAMSDAVRTAPAAASYRVGLVDFLYVREQPGVSEAARRQSVIESLLVLGGGLQHNRLSVDMNARSAALFRTLVVEFDETGQVPAAVAAFERTAQLLPNHWLPKRNLGAILLDVGLPAEAIVPLGEAADILGEHPAAANVLLLQGLSFVSSGRRAEAEAALREGLRFASDERDEALLREALVTLGADLEG